MPFFGGSLSTIILFAMQSEADLSDSEMEKLDDVLGAAFRSMKKGKRDEKERSRELRDYRMKCLDLLAIVTHNEATDINHLLVRHVVSFVTHTPSFLLFVFKTSVIYISRYEVAP